MDDVERSAPSATEITYGGRLLASIAPGQVATLACAGKLMRASVMVRAGNGSGAAYSSVITDGVTLLIRTAAVTREDESTLQVT